jgi:lipocalin
MFLLLLLSIYGCFSQTVPELNVTKYLGNWYQVYGAPTNVLFQGYGTCITAQYELDGNITIVNSQLNRTNGLEQIKGYAYSTGSEPGKLTVHLDGVPVDSPYWIIKLGDSLEKYTYSIITVPSGISLWVLARNVEEFYEKYDEEVKEFLSDFIYVPISQTNCEYYFE